MSTPANALNVTQAGLVKFDGTNAFTGVTTTQHDVLVGAASNGITSVSPSTSGFVLVSNGTSADPSFQATTAIIPTGASGTVLQGQGAGVLPAYSTATYPATTTASQLLYSSSTNTVAGLATANSGVLTTNSSGVPAIDTTNFAVLSTGVQMKGNNTNTAPPAGFIGQKISAVSGSVSLTNGAPANVITVNLTAGIWDVSAMCLVGFTGVGTLFQVGISTTSATITGSPGQDWSQTNGTLTASGFTITIPNIRGTLSTTTTYYLVAEANFSTGTCNAFGSLQATRVG